MKIKTLLVEDDPKLRLLFRRLLEKNFELDVSEASNGVEGLTLTNSIKPALVFLDFDMPVMNGVEYLEAIRNEAETKDLLVVMMTAENDPKIVQEILQYGVTDYILKTDRFDELTARISKIIGKYKNLLVERTRKNMINQGNINNKIVFAFPSKNFEEKARELLKKSCNIFSADNGPDALSQYLEQKPVLVILRENLPLLNETKIVQKIRELDIEKLTSVYVLTSNKDYALKDKFDELLLLTENIESDLDNLWKSINKKITLKPIYPDMEEEAGKKE